MEQTCSDLIGEGHYAFAICWFVPLEQLHDHAVVESLW